MLELHEKTTIFDAEGRELGGVDSFVVDPSNKTLTHVVIARGAIFPDERIVPIEALEETDSGVRLRAGVDPIDLPKYTSSHYLDADPASASGWSNAVIWAYPLPSGAGFPAYPTLPQFDRGVTRNISQDRVVVHEGSDVVSSEGTKVGAITEAAITDDGRLSHIMVDPGFFKSEKMIPGHWIAEIDEDRVVLAVTDETLAKHDDR